MFPPWYPPPWGYGAAPPPGMYPWPTANAPPVMDYEDGKPIPPGYTLESRTRKGPIIGGVITFGVNYLVSAVFATTACDAYCATRDQDAAAAFFVPVAGPIIAIGLSDGDDKFLFPAVFSAAQQILGVSLLAYGMFFEEQVLVLKDLPVQGKLTLLPAISPSTAGIQIVGAM